LRKSKWKIEDLFQAAGVEARLADPNAELTGITDNSRQVEPGFLFVATRGTQCDSHLFISDAVERGAAAVVVGQDIPAYGNVEVVRLEDSRDGLGRLSHAWYGNPTRHMHVFGVSGTNGKTTTTYLLESILSHAGLNPGVIGTIEHRYAGRRQAATNTTPSALQLAQLMAQMRAEGVDAVAMEVSSHSVDQQRIAGIEFDVGILTNITQDHLDYHKTMEAYAAAKSAFYFDYLLRPKRGAGKPAPSAVFNLDDEWGARFASEFPGGKLTFGSHESADVYPVDLELGASGVRFTVPGPGGDNIAIRSPLLGQFNVMNILGAISAAIAAKLPSAAIRDGIAALASVPGRFDRVFEGQEFAVVVDYAHTPDALERVLANARSMTGGCLITVFGCGGDRDPVKRPIMGKVAGSLSDVVILTNDNPRTEDPASIAAMVLEGIRQSPIAGEQTLVLLDRRVAIETALGMAKPGDFVMIAGKGAEDYQILGLEKVHFDDRETARECLNALKQARTSPY
jgi:UDP-N-acetylmuramoyl-L-alanyl-D-glutamate--2,6-diaminopimelate ligase